MSLTSSIILGFIRLCFMLLFLFYLNRKLVNRSGNNNFLEFLVWQWFRYGTIMGIVIFLTVQLGIYDLMNCIFILVLIILIDYIGLKNLRNPRAYFEKQTKAQVQQFVKSLDLDRPLKSWFTFSKTSKKGRESGLYILLLVIVLAVITFLSRIYFFNYDSYSLSSIWITDLEKIIDFDSQHWFGGESSVIGDLAYVNFYGKIANVSPEIALQSIGILESVLISVLVFWVIRKITTSKNLAPIVASLSFALVYTLSPINIYFVLQNKPIFLALTFGLPAMVFYLKPNLLKMSTRTYFLSFFLVFITIGLVDLFTLYILFPPFLLLALLFAKRKTGSFQWTGLLAYLLAAATIIGIYVLFCIYFETDLKMFLHSSLLSISSYTYVPQLVIPFDRLLFFYQLGTFAGILLLLKFTFYNKENWRGAFVFLIYFNLLLVLRHLHNSWIDDDLLTQSLSVFLPIVAGITIAIVIRLFQPLFARFTKLNIVAVALVFGGIVFSAIHYQKETISKLTESDVAQREVLDAYDRISKNYFPYSYAVVNDNTTQILSTNKHFFINYSDFIYNYPAQDSIYFKNIHNPKFIKENPDDVIPKSVLVFVFDKNDQSESYAENGELKPILMDQLNLLKKRGRKIELFYDSKHIKVYEIINERKASRITDLIF